MMQFWKNPLEQGYGRLPMGSLGCGWDDPQQALSDALHGPEQRNLRDNPRYVSLDGTWRFLLVESPDAVDVSHKGWTSPTYDHRGWHEIQVPGTWTRQGFDKPHYTNVGMPFSCIPPEVPAENPTGLYRIEVELESSWLDTRVILHVGSAESCLIVHANGFEVGGSKDTRLESSFDLTPYLNGRHLVLALQVVRYSDGSYLEDQDQWWFGGLLRSVYLTSRPFVSIADIDIRATIPPLTNPATRAPGMLSLEVQLDGMPLEDGSPEVWERMRYQVVWQLYQSSSQNLLCGDASLVMPSSMIEGVGVRFHRDIGEVDLWSSEHPHLHILVVMLYRDETLLDCHAQSIGFRHIEISNRQLLINGAPVHIKGVNRHEHDQFTGKTLSLASMLTDIALLKEHHFNAVRTSHYPNEPVWYELCDRYGIYLVDEANIESHAFYDRLCDDPQWAQAFLARGMRMVLRDKHHPSIIIWSLGNESGCGANHALLASWIRRYDPSRPVQYEGAVRPQGPGQRPFTVASLQGGRELTDVVCPMYAPIDLVEQWSEFPDDRPLIQCEYSHAMGNSNGGLSDYWDSIRSHHGLQGGFIWDWMDQGLVATDPSGNPYWAYGGDFGDTPTDKDFCLNGLLFPDLTPKPAMAECAYLFQPVATNCEFMTDTAEVRVEVFNRYDFSPLDHVTSTWQLLLNGKPIGSGMLELGRIDPSESTIFFIPVASEYLSHTSGEVVFHIVFEAKNDSTLAKLGQMLGVGQCIIQPWSLYVESLRKIEFSQSALADLGLSEFVPHLFRAPTENDGLKTFLESRNDPAFAFYHEGKAMYGWFDLGLDRVQCIAEAGPDTHYQWYRLIGHGHDPALNGVDDREGEGTVTTEPHDLGIFGSNWHVGTNGSLVYSARFELDGSLDRLPRIGVKCRLPAGYTQVSWYGRGPHEAYPDRCASAMLGWYSSTIEDLEVPYIVPQEQGNRMGVRFLELSGPTVRTLRMEFPEPMQFSIVCHEDDDVWRATHHHMLHDTRRDGYWNLHLDIAQRGLGTASCGPDTLDEITLVKPAQFLVHLRMEPLEGDLG